MAGGSNDESEHYGKIASVSEHVVHQIQSFLTHQTPVRLVDECAGNVMAVAKNSDKSNEESRNLNSADSGVHSRTQSGSESSFWGSSQSHLNGCGTVFEIFEDGSHSLLELSQRRLPSDADIFYYLKIPIQMRQKENQEVVQAQK